MLSMDFLFYFALSDRKIKNLEESYEQDKNNQTAVIVKPNRK